MIATASTPVTAESRLVRYEDLVPCRLAFIDCKLPGSDSKVNYSIIGPGVTQSAEQHVNIAEPHGFALGVAAMPHGVTNNLHMHYTAEVFMIYRGEWTFRWGPEGKDGEIVGRAGDTLSIPTWIFRGFTNTGPDDSWIFTLLGQDESGGVVWHPSILDSAAEQGLYLNRDGMLVDTTTGAQKPADDDLVTPMSASDIAALRRYSPEQMRARMVTADELVWSDTAFLDHVLPGHRSAIAPVIGAGLSEDRDAEAKIRNPHGFSLDYMRIEPGQEVGPFRIGSKQVLIVREGALEVVLGRNDERDSAVADPWATFSVPADCWRTYRSVGDEPVLMSVTTAGDARPAIEWDDAIVDAALAAGLGRDPNGYLAPASLLPAA
jgi:mannose-6-phosphate isomerase-like protein (cupin superfamily)